MHAGDRSIGGDKKLDIGREQFRQPGGLFVILAQRGDEPRNVSLQLGSLGGGQRAPSA